MRGLITHTENDVNIPVSLLVNRNQDELSKTYDDWFENRDSKEFEDEIRNHGHDAKIRIEVHPYGTIKLVSGIDQIMVARMLDSRFMLADVEYFDDSEKLHRIKYAS